ncbi:MAG: polyphosphate kinase 1 [Flavobacteriaceae bacterium]|nr:polyphosphate kinase 1 [Flavobacteriaceae bacterium]
MENQYINREISWLQFNDRVLQEAADKNMPLIERLRFIGIFSNNLDEFFKVRYATVKRIAMAGKKIKNIMVGYEPKALMDEITQIVIHQQEESLRILEEIRVALKNENIYIINENQISTSQDEFIRNYFVNEVSPALVTIILNDLKALNIRTESAAYLAVKMVMKTEQKQSGLKKLFHPTKKDIQYALIEIPKSINRFVVLPDEGEKKFIIILDDLIRYNLKSIFNIFNYETLSAHMIKITRDAELDLDSDLSKSFVEKLSESIKGRSESQPVRFVYDSDIDKDTLDYLLDKMGFEKNESIIPGGKYHNRRDYMSFPSLHRSDLQFKQYPPLPIKGLELQGSLIKKIAQKDYLLYAPYHTFSYVIKFLREAALDPKVKSIKITIYRLAKVSQIASSLINAAKNGKKVTVQIELQARFDEANNIRYAEKFQEEGIKIIFGVPGLKVHSKVCVIEREEAGEIKRYGLISTGNFNESTAKIYTDYTLFTAHPALLKEVNKLFEFFETSFKVHRYKHLIVSPHYTRNKFFKLIDAEIDNAKAGREAYIHLKINSITDIRTIDKLYEASRAGVKLRMIVRGICCLVPGVKNMSENIEVISILDKYLEHPRLFIFGNNQESKVFISSADWMERNLDARVEVGCPIYDESIKQELIDTFEICWSDNVKARIISANPNNEYRRNNHPRVRSQFATYDYYLEKMSNKN